MLFLIFENRRDFSATDLQAWSNIALATAASGNYKDGAEIFEWIVEILESGRALVSDDMVSERMRSDAIAMWIQHAEAEDDLQTLLDHLQRRTDLTAASFMRSLPRDSIQSFRDNYAATQFNQGLILEKLGLYTPAIESYRRSLEQTDDRRWNEETVRRINRISHRSRREHWAEERTRLEAASRGHDVSTIREIVRLFPEHTRIATERDYLATWAREALVGSSGERTPHLEIARSIGTARRDLFADSLIADVVRVIDYSIQKKDARKIDNLARGFLLYEQASAAETFEEAAEAFDIAGSPMANIVRFRAIATRFDAVHIDQSLEQLRELDRRVPAGHRILRAMIHGAIGNCLAERGELEGALETYTRARRIFEALGEADSVAAIRASAAHMLTLMGHPVEAWRVRRPALRTADASGDPALVEFVFRYTASDELFNRKEGRALALYSSMLPLPPLYARPGEEYIGSRWRNPVPLRSRQVMLDALSDRPLPADVQNDLRFAQAISLYQRKPEQAETLLSESIAFAEATGRVAMLPYVYFYRAIARCETERGNNTIRDLNVYYGTPGRCDAKREDDAIRDLTDAISLLEARRRNTVRRDLRDLWYRVADDLFPEVMNLHWNRGDNDAFFVLGERRRGMSVPDGVTIATGDAEPLTAEGVADRLEPGVAVIVFTASLRNPWRRSSRKTVSKCIVSPC